MLNLRHLAAATLLLSIVAPAQAQTSRGTLSGIVTDASGATLPNATVKLTNKETNQNRATTTNDSGLYRFDAVDPGSYELNVSATGFSLVRGAYAARPGGSTRVSGCTAPGRRYVQLG